MKYLVLTLTACCMLASCKEKVYEAVPHVPATVYDVQVYVHGTLVRSYDANTPAPFHDKSYNLDMKAVSFTDGAIITSCVLDKSHSAAGTGIVFVATPKVKGGSHE